MPPLADAIARVSTHSRTEAAALLFFAKVQFLLKFQHTAARRRLPVTELEKQIPVLVSTHSRTEAAALG